MVFRCDPQEQALPCRTFICDWGFASPEVAGVSQRGVSEILTMAAFSIGTAWGPLRAKDT